MFGKARSLEIKVLIVKVVFAIYRAMVWSKFLDDVIRFKQIFIPLLNYYFSKLTFPLLSIDRPHVYKRFRLPLIDCAVLIKNSTLIFIEATWLFYIELVTVGIEDSDKFFNTLIHWMIDCRWWCRIKQNYSNNARSRWRSRVDVCNTFPKIRQENFSNICSRNCIK